MSVNGGTQQSSGRSVTLDPNRANTPKTLKPIKATAAIKSAPKVVTPMTALVIGPDLKKRELLEQIAERTGQSKNKARPFVDAMIEIMGDAISKWGGLNLPPMGKVKLVRSKDAGNAKVTVAKIRQVKPQSDPGA